MHMVWYEKIYSLWIGALPELVATVAEQNRDAGLLREIFSQAATARPTASDLHILARRVFCGCSSCCWPTESELCRAVLLAIDWHCLLIPRHFNIGRCDSEDVP